MPSEALGPEVSQMRTDWQTLCRQYSSSMPGLPAKGLLDLISFTSHREEDGNWKHGISPTVKNVDQLLIAHRFVVCNAQLQAVSLGLNTLPRLLLGSEDGVLSVTLLRELRGGIAIVTTSGGRSVFVMSDTGRIVGDEDFGIEPKFCDLLHCDELGRRRER